MQRREFIALFVGISIAWPAPAQAQQAGGYGGLAY